jgi:thymidylate synthase
MSIVGTINAANVSDAWRQVAGALLRVDGRKGAHLVVRIADGTAEEEHTRSAVDALMAQHGLQSIDTVANTIFPATLAARHGQDPLALAERYRKLLPTLRRLNRDKNKYGTYFGRMVSYPGPDGTIVDQLNGTIDKLRTEHTGRGKASSRYEVAYQTGQDIERETTGHYGADTVADTQTDGHYGGAVAEVGGDGRALLTYSPGAKDDRRRMGFPCLSLASFHLDGDTLHLAAHYRNQNVIERAYGNYLGLGRLHAYVARCCGLDLGELLVVSGHIELEHVTGVPDIVHGQQALLV